MGRTTRTSSRPMRSPGRVEPRLPTMIQESGPEAGPTTRKAIDCERSPTKELAPALQKNVNDAYRYLMEVYEASDRIYLSIRSTFTLPPLDLTSRRRLPRPEGHGGSVKRERASIFRPIGPSTDPIKPGFFRSRGARDRPETPRIGPRYPQNWPQFGRGRGTIGRMETLTAVAAIAGAVTALLAALAGCSRTAARSGELRGRIDAVERTTQTVLVILAGRGAPAAGCRPLLQPGSPRRRPRRNRPVCRWARSRPGATGAASWSTA